MGCSGLPLKFESRSSWFKSFPCSEIFPRHGIGQKEVQLDIDFGSRGCFLHANVESTWRESSPLTCVFHLNINYSNKDWFSCQNLLYKILGFGLPRFFHTFWSSKIATVDLQRCLDCFPTEFRSIWDVQLPRYIMLHHVTTFDYTFGSPLGYWAKRIGNQSHGLYWHRESYLLKLPVTRIYQNWCVVSNLQFSTQVGW